MITSKLHGFTCWNPRMKCFLHFNCFTTKLKLNLTLSSRFFILIMARNMCLMFFPLTSLSMISSIKLLVLVLLSKMGLLRDGTDFSLRSPMPCFICMFPKLFGLMLSILQFTWWTICPHISWDLNVPLSFSCVLLLDYPLFIRCLVAYVMSKFLNPKALNVSFLGML